MAKSYTVYMHTTPSNKCYIGITGQSIYKRWQRGGGYANNDYFTKAINKYGWDNIKSEVLYENLTLEEAKEKEIALIKKYKATDREHGYNIREGGNNNGKHSEETKKKIGKAHLGNTYGRLTAGKSRVKPSKETRMKMSRARKGMKLTKEWKNNISAGKQNISKETRMKLSKSLKGRASPNKGIPMTEEQKKKIGDANRGRVFSEETRQIFKDASTRKKTVIQYDLNMNEIRTFESTMDAQRETGIANSNISACCRGKLKTSGGYIWRYKEENTHI